MTIRKGFLLIALGISIFAITKHDNMIMSKSFMSNYNSSSTKRLEDFFNTNDRKSVKNSRKFIVQFTPRTPIQLPKNYNYKSRANQRRMARVVQKKVHQKKDIKQTNNTIRMKPKFKDGIYYLTELDFQGRFNLMNSTDFDGEVEILNNQDVNETEVRISNLMVNSGKRDVMNLDISTKLIGQSIVNYNVAGVDYPMSVRTDGKKRIVMTAIHGPYKGARMFFSTEKPEYLGDRMVASQPDPSEIKKPINQDDGYDRSYENDGREQNINNRAEERADRSRDAVEDRAKETFRRDSEFQERDVRDYDREVYREDEYADEEPYYEEEAVHDDYRDERDIEKESYDF